MLSDLLRLQHVRRWHIVNVIKEQTVADHSWAVGLIAMKLLERADEAQFSAQAAQYAIVHDLDEVFVGDIPTPTKKALGFDVPEDLLPEVKQIIDATPMAVKMAVKLADFIEAEYFLVDHGVGPHAADVRKGIYSGFLEYVQSLQANGKHSLSSAAVEIRNELHRRNKVVQLWDLI